ncbi:MAG: hypothetical protein M4579_005853 [Chaenotheca gracillima]|nr:MAG: hypothetical protein M4579_005853 [Chaenotheca gracillima]
MDSPADLFSNTFSELDSQILTLREQIRTLFRRKSALTSALSNSRTTKLILDRGDPSWPSTKDTTGQTSNSKAAVDRLQRELRGSRQSLYRICAGATMFEVKDPDPHATDLGRVFGVRIEAFVKDKFDIPYYLLMNRHPSQPTYMHIHKHTVPPSIPLRHLVAKYLPGPESPFLTAGRKSMRSQNLPRFVRELRRDLIAFHLRKASVEHLDHMCASMVQPFASTMRSVTAVDAEYRDICLEWRDGKIGRLRISKHGVVERSVVIQSERDRDLERKLLKERGRLEDLWKHATLISKLAKMADRWAKKHSPSNYYDGINDTFSQRLRLLATVYLKRKNPRHGFVLELTPNVFVKACRLNNLSEARAMKFVAENSRVPVPKVLCAFKRKGITYIAMEKVPGKMIAQHLYELSEKDQAAILAELRGIINELRSIKPPCPGRVGDYEYSLLYDDRIQRAGFGPFDTVKEFHEFLRQGIGSGTNIPGMDELVTAHERREHTTCFTHGDLSSFNIMAKDGKITGIIDWEMAGWFPDYYEYSATWHVNPQDWHWQRHVGRFLEEWPEDLEMDKIRRDIFPPW